MRFLAAQTCNPSPEPVDPKRPLVLAVDASGGPRIAALSADVEDYRLGIGDPIADARAKIEGLQVRAAVPAADAASLARLAWWATRYTPAVAPWGEANGADGLFLDITGAAHLFGGEERLIDDLARRLADFGVPSRLAIADTPGAAWALSHFHASANIVLPSGDEAKALATLPIEALRLSPDTSTTLRRLGFKRIGAVTDKPRAPFAARFSAELLLRLDQALGRAPEPLAFIAPPPAYHTLRQLLEPISLQDDIVTAAARLMEDDIAPALLDDGVGARVLRLALYRTDGEVAMVDIELVAPTRSPQHVTRLLALKLERIIDTIDAGFGFEALGLTVTAFERLELQQAELTNERPSAGKAEGEPALIDSLRQRLGLRNVRRLRAVESHMPERAEAPCSAQEDVSAWPVPDAGRPRPVLLLGRAEPAQEVIALVPEGPPRRFRWRGAIHNVVRAQGPERIASEWWRHRKRQPTRDYYLVEAESGQRFWLYREGLYGRETSEPRWYVHGVFA